MNLMNCLTIEEMDYLEYAKKEKYDLSVESKERQIPCVCDLCLPIDGDISLIKSLGFDSRAHSPSGWVGVSKM